MTLEEKQKELKKELSQLLEKYESSLEVEYVGSKEISQNDLHIIVQGDPGTKQVLRINLGSYFY